MTAAHGFPPTLPPGGARRLLGPASVAGRLASPLHVLRVWRLRRRYRADLRRLLRLGSYLIDDIGLVLEEAEGEARKPFWRP